MDSMDKKLLFIVNPRAGKAKSLAPLFSAAGIYSEAGYLISSGNELQVEYAGRMLSLNHLKLSKRDGKGVKAKK